MQFEWDPRKCAKNIDKHGLDFNDVDIVFGSPYFKQSAKPVNDEERWLAVGMIDETYVTVVCTMRGSVIRIISMRRARDGERRKHQEIFGS